MSIIEQINKSKLPHHIAIIMDGNGRWAKKQGLLRFKGHETGIESVREVVESCAEIGIKELTLYAFSTENWRRPKAEVNTLMRILVNSLRKEINTLQDNDIKLNAVGRLQELPKSVFKKLNEVILKTKDNKTLTLTLALSYGSREEITSAVKDIATKVKNNIISVDAIDQSIINNHLYTQNLKNVDLVIRTSGEQRISNFMLWQIAYAELYFTSVLWPDFRKEDLYKAILNYQNRERRFGKTSEQLN